MCVCECVCEGFMMCEYVCVCVRAVRLIEIESQS